MRLVVGITGATGAVLGIRLLTALQTLNVETHLVLSQWARATIRQETGATVRQVQDLADHIHGTNSQFAAIASGSYRTDGMIIIPCSMRTVAAIRSGSGEGLIHRAADVTLKESRRLVLVPRESPLSVIHLENMLALARAGVVLCPPMPSFYLHPESLDDIIDQVVARVLDQFGLELPGVRRWEGHISSPACERNDGATDIR